MTSESTALWEVSFEGGLRVGSGAYAPPVLGAMGVIVSDGVSWVELQTTEEWVPLASVPALRLPKLNGRCEFYPDGTDPARRYKRIEEFAFSSLTSSVETPFQLAGG